MDHDKATPQELRWRIAQLETRLAEQVRINSEIANSTIWRATAPLRNLLVPISQLKKQLAGKSTSAFSQFVPPKISHVDAFGTLTAQPWVAGFSARCVSLDFVWEKESDDGQAIGLRHIYVFDNELPRSAPLVKIDLRAGGNAGPFKIFGFAPPEAWGVWTISKASRILLWLPKTASNSFRLEIVGGTRDNSSQSDGPALLVNGNSHGRVAFSGAGLLQSPFTINSAVTTSNAKNLSKLPDAKPAVSVIILNLNKPYLTYLAVAALLSAKTDLTYEILVLDNGSQPESAGVISSMDMPIRWLRLEENRFFGEGNNIAAEMARGDALLFLNNDAFVEDGLLDGLYGALTSSKEIGAAGPAFYYPDGTLQEAGAFIAKDASVYQRGKGTSDFDLAQLPEYDQVDYVSAACLMVNRNKFLQVGGFDLRYDPAYYEDSDLCLRLLDQGLKTVLVRDCGVKHIENATTASPENAKLTSNITERHRAIFLTRWQNWLRARDVADLPKIETFPIEATQSITSALEPGAGINCAYTPYKLAHGGGERYLLSAALSMTSGTNAAPAAIVTPTLYSQCRVNTLSRELGLRLGALSALALPQLASYVTQRYIHMGNEVLPSMPGLGKANVFHCQFPFPGNLPVPSVEIGLANLATYQTVVVNSQFTRDAYLRALGDISRQAVDVRVIYPPVRLLSPYDTPKEKIILSLGRFSPEGHSKRQDLLIVAFKELKAAGALAGWRLVLAGTVPNDPASTAYFDQQRQAAAGLDVSFVLSPDTQQLADLYYRASIYVSATGADVTQPKQYHSCEHFGITVIEAMSAGCLVVAAQMGGPAEVIATMGSGLTFSKSSNLRETLLQATDAYSTAGVHVDTARLHSLYSEERFLLAWTDLWRELS